MTLVIGPTGAIDAGELVDETRGRVPVVGQADGRDIGLLFMLDDGRVVSAEGVAQDDGDLCFGDTLGSVAAHLPDGSQPYGLGTWNATEFAALGAEQASRGVTAISRGETMGLSRIDAFSRALATATPRRSLLGLLPGAGAALLAALGMGRRPAAAHMPASTQEGAVQQCVGVFRAKTAEPTAESTLELDGDLTLEIGPTGSIDAGTLVDRTLGPISVQGTVNGRRISLLFALEDDDRRLAAGGTAENEVLQCQGGVYGTFVVASTNEESLPGDLGSWEFVA